MRHFRALRLNFALLALHGSFVRINGEEASGRDAESKQSLRLEVATGHSFRVAGVAFSPDSVTLASASWDGTVRLWEVQTGVEISILCKDEAGFGGVAFSPNGTLVAAAGMSSSVWLCDLNTKKVFSLRGHRGPVTTVAFAPDGNSVLSAGEDNTIKEWGVTEGRLIRTFLGHSASVKSLAYSPDSKSFASGDKDGFLRLWDTSSASEIKVLKVPYDQVWSIVFSPRGADLAYAWGSEATLCNATSGAEVRSFLGHENRVTCIDFSRNGKRIATGSEDRTVRIWDATTGASLCKLEIGGGAAIVNLAIDPTDPTLLAVCQLNEVQLWDAKSRKKLRSLGGHSLSVQSIAVSFDGKTIASGSGSGDFSVKIWDILAAKVVRTLEGARGSISSLVMDSEGGLLAAGGADGNLWVWDPRSGKRLRSFSVNPEASIRCDMNSSGSLLVTGCLDGKVGFWNPRSGTKLRELLNGPDSVYSVAFSLKGNLVAAGLADGKVKLWQARSGQQMMIVETGGPVRCVGITHDEKMMATAGFRGGVILWDLPAGVQRGYLDGLFGGATAIAFNFGGSLLAIGSDDGTVELYDPTTCKRMATLCGHANSVMALAFSPHGDKALYSGSVDGSVRVWRVGASENHELCALYSFADGSWVVLTPEGRYDSSSDGANLHIRGRIGQRFIPLSDLRKDHYESGLLRKVLKTDQEK